MRTKLLTGSAIVVATLLAPVAHSSAQAAALRGNISIDEVTASPNLIEGISSSGVDFNNNSGVFTVNFASGDFAPFLGSGVTINDLDVSSIAGGGSLDFFTVAAGGPTFVIRNLIDPVFTDGTLGDRFSTGARGFFRSIDGSRSEAISILLSVDASSGLNDNVDFTLTTVPTPAMLPALIGMGVAAFRRRKSEAEAASEA